MKDLIKETPNKIAKEDIKRLIRTNLQTYDDFRRLIKDPSMSSNLRSIAIWVLGKLKVKKAEKLFLEVIKSGEKNLCEQASVSLLNIADSKKIVNPLISILLHSKNIKSRLAAAYSLSFMRERRSFKVFITIADNEQEGVDLRSQALEGLAYYLEYRRNRKGLDIIRKLLKHKTAKIRFWAIFAVGTAKDKNSLPILRHIVKMDKAKCQRFWTVKKEAKEAIYRIENGKWPDMGEKGDFKRRQILFK